MDGEKKRKRTDNSDFNGRGGDRSKHEVETTEDKEETVVLPPPSEAEVNEFFAILRRMRMALKYLQRNVQIQPENVNAHGTMLTASGNGVVHGQKRVEEIELKGGFDLNTLPDGGD